MTSRESKSRSSSIPLSRSMIEPKRSWKKLFSLSLAEATVTSSPENSSGFGQTDDSTGGGVVSAKTRLISDGNRRADAVVVVIVVVDQGSSVVVVLTTVVVVCIVDVVVVVRDSVVERGMVN